MTRARGSKSDFSHHNTLCFGEIKYLITACSMCSVLHSLLKALTVLSRELKSSDTRTRPQRSRTSTKQHCAYRQGKTKQQKKQIYEGQLLVRQGGIFFLLQVTNSESHLRPLLFQMPEVITIFPF